MRILCVNKNLRSKVGVVTASLAVHRRIRFGVTVMCLERPVLTSDGLKVTLIVRLFPSLASLVIATGAHIADVTSYTCT